MKDPRADLATRLPLQPVFSSGSRTQSSRPTYFRPRALEVDLKAFTLELGLVARSPESVLDPVVCHLESIAAFKHQHNLHDALTNSLPYI